MIRESVRAVGHSQQLQHFQVLLPSNKTDLLTIFKSQSNIWSIVIPTIKVAHEVLCGIPTDISELRDMSTGMITIQDT